MHLLCPASPEAGEGSWRFLFPISADPGVPVVGVSSGVQGPPGVRGLGCFPCGASGFPGVDQPWTRAEDSALPWPPGTLSAGLGQCRDELQRTLRSTGRGALPAGGTEDEDEEVLRGACREQGLAWQAAGAWLCPLPSVTSGIAGHFSGLQKVGIRVTRPPDPKPGAPFWQHHVEVPGPCQLPPRGRAPGGLSRRWSCVSGNLTR